MTNKHIVAFIFLTLLSYTIFSSIGLDNELFAEYSQYIYVVQSIVIAAINTYVFRNLIDNKKKNTKVSDDG